jgi:hypothetical protein
LDNAIFYASMFHAVKYVRLSEIFQMVRMVRKACGSFALMKAGDKPGDPEVEEPYELEGVFEWLRELPEQIERAVI